MPERARLKQGSTIPAKFRLRGANGVYYQDPGAYLTVYSCTALTVSACNTTVYQAATPFRYDATAGQHIYNMNTPKTWTGIFRFVGQLSPSFAAQVTGQKNPNSTFIGFLEITK